VVLHLMPVNQQLRGYLTITTFFWYGPADNKI
jgi:hypothetical protein